MKKTCCVPDCPTPVLAKGLCRMHYQRKQKTGTTDLTPFVPKACSVESCGKTSRVKGYCQAHYEKWSRYGDPLVDRSNTVKHLACEIQDCDKFQKTKGLCATHYRNYRYHRDKNGVVNEQVYIQMKNHKSKEDGSTRR